jgi:hypothetical protein
MPEPFSGIRECCPAWRPSPVLYGQAVLCPHSPQVVMKPLSLHWEEGVPYPQQQ